MRLANKVGEVAIVDEQHRDHRTGDQQIVDGHRLQRRFARREVEQHVGHVDDQRHDQCRRAQMHQREDAADHGHRHVEGNLALGESIAVGIQGKRPESKTRRDRRCNPIGEAQVAQDVGIVADDTALAQPPECAKACHRDQHGRHDHTERGRRQRHIGISHRDRVGDQDEIEQRDLF
ncbi:hypothetical protein ACVWZW_005674 [Bradyrhizobium sp. F1.13.4]